jgi:hypothetical protein
MVGEGRMMKSNLAWASLFDELVEAVAERVAKKVAPTPTPPVTYTTNKRGPHFPGRSRRWMLDHIRSMPGARKIGRNWEISATDYEAWKSHEDAAQVRAASGAARRSGTGAVRSVDVDELTERAKSSLRAAGYRRSL